MSETALVEQAMENKYNGVSIKLKTYRQLICNYLQLLFDYLQILFDYLQLLFDHLQLLF